MEAKLNIYDYNENGELVVVKTYTCQRLILKVSKKISALIEQMEGKNEDDQENLTIAVIKTIFPTFKDEEFDCIDPIEWLNFVNQINEETNQILNIASKN